MKLISSIAVLAALLEKDTVGASPPKPYHFKCDNGEPCITMEQLGNYDLKKKLLASKTFDDDLINDLLISKRPGLHHLLYDEVIELMQLLKDSFPEFLTFESIGKTGENRDIWMMKLDSTKLRTTNQDHDPKAILLTGAHHARELVSVQMPLYSVLDLCHGYLHGDHEKTQLLLENKYFVIPMLNTDGSYTIYDEYLKTGQLIYKRKNNDRVEEKKQGKRCSLERGGTDINRNYGYLWGNGLGPCDESYAGPHAFSEPET